MKVAVATLCDAATVREGLLSILSSGITQVSLGDLPAPLRLMFAVSIEAQPEEVGDPIRADAILTREDDQFVLASLRAEVEVDPEAASVIRDGSMPTTIPLVFDFGGVAVQAKGMHVVTLVLNNEVRDSRRVMMWDHQLPAVTPG